MVEKTPQAMHSIKRRRPYQHECPAPCAQCRRECAMSRIGDRAGIRMLSASTRIATGAAPRRPSAGAAWHLRTMQDPTYYRARSSATVIRPPSHGRSVGRPIHAQARVDRLGEPPLSPRSRRARWSSLGTVSTWRRGTGGTSNEPHGAPCRRPLGMCRPAHAVPDDVSVSRERKDDDNGQIRHLQMRRRRSCLACRRSPPVRAGDIGHTCAGARAPRLRHGAWRRQVPGVNQFVAGAVLL